MCVIDGSAAAVFVTARVHVPVNDTTVKSFEKPNGHFSSDSAQTSGGGRGGVSRNVLKSPGKACTFCRENVSMDFGNAFLKGEKKFPRWFPVTKHIG